MLRRISAVGQIQIVQPAALAVQRAWSLGKEMGDAHNAPSGIKIEKFFG